MLGAYVFDENYTVLSRSDELQKIYLRRCFYGKRKERDHYDGGP